MMVNRDKALILFSRLPLGRETKTRLAPLLDEKEREELHCAMWADVFGAVSELRGTTDLFLYWTGSGNVKDYAALIPPFFHLREQCEGNLGERMRRAMSEAFEAGYAQALIIGTDVPGIRPGHLYRAFAALDDDDIVLGPSLDGGYWLIGMRRSFPEAFDLPAWGREDLLHTTLERIKDKGLTCALADTLLDIDTPEDVKKFLSQPSSHDQAAGACLERLLSERGRDVSKIQ